MGFSERVETTLKLNGGRIETVGGYGGEGGGDSDQDRLLTVAVR